MDEMERDIIEMTDDAGNTIQMEVIDYFFYNGDEFVILTDTIPEDEDDDPEELNCYVMKVITSKDEATGEELETFEPIEDAELEERVMAVANTVLNEEEPAEE